MKTTRARNLLVPFVTAILLLFQISPALAGGAPKPGDDNRRHVEVTFTKWITNTAPLTAPVLMAGFVGGDVTGDFVGEVLANQTSANGRIGQIEAIYEVQAGSQSFTALIRGGINNQTGAALLDGVVLAGWRTGDRVHVEFQVVNGCGQPGAFLDRCFTGTIHID